MSPIPHTARPSARHHDPALGRQCGPAAGAALADQASRAPASPCVGAASAAQDALLAALRARDPGLFQHAQAVAEFAALLGRALGWPAHRRESLRRAALLHDIGKLGIPDLVAGRPGPLSPEQAVVIMEHPALGAALLAAIPALADLAPMVRHHHERHDGAGYPDGRAGAAIPAESRALALADAFEAMTADRPHRPALPPREALRRLEAGAGTQFDPDFARAFVAAIRSAPGGPAAALLRRRADATRGTPAAPPPAYAPLGRPDRVQARGGRVLLALLRQPDAFWGAERLLGRIAAALAAALPRCDVRAWAAPAGLRPNPAPLPIVADHLPGRAWLALGHADAVLGYLEVIARGGDSLTPDDWQLVTRLAPQLGELLAAAGRQSA